MKPVDGTTPQVFEFGDFRLEAGSRRLLRAGEQVPLTPKLFDTLLYLVQHRGAVASRDELLTALWPDAVVEENNLGQAISKLRHVLGEAPGDNRYIATISGRGYRFVAPVTQGAKDVDGNAVSEMSPGTGVSARAQETTPARPADTQPRGARLTMRALALAALALASVVLGALYIWRSPAVPAVDVDLPRTLAVLPFKPLVPGGRDEALEFGMADSLIANLGHIRGLTVRPLASVRRFHEPTLDPFAAGRELGVEAVLDGYIHRADKRIRMTVRLLRVSDERQLWAGQFDEELTSIFSIQDAISERVTRALAVRLSAQEEQRVATRHTGDPAAYELYLRGRFFISLAQPRNAIEMFEQAARLDPGFAPAHAGLADTLSRLPIATNGPSSEAMHRARTLAQTALDIDSELGDAHAVLGWIGFYYDWDWAASERHYLRALAIDSASFSARLGYAHLLSNTHRPDEAIQHVELALAADPLSPLAGSLRSQFLFYAGRPEEAHDQLQRTLETSPAFWIAEVLLGRLHLEQRRYDAAAAAFSRAADAGGVWTPRALAGYAYAAAGDRERAQRTLAELIGAGSAPPYAVATVHLGLDDRPQALAWLERGYDEKDVRMVFLGVDPLWAPLHPDPRFVDLLRRMNLAR
ncbi:MAG: winged helix-turn-helix domain-containing protein [Acidobacteria bacterium]|nr:winged helix-turn-helix domain-containing protein [Acidobacteriota bacterium]